MKSQMYYLRMCVYFILVINLFLSHVTCKAVEAEADEEAISRQGQPVVIPDWVKEALGESYSDESQNTTKRPQIGDILGQGIQGIFQGIVKAPADIANRVQGILDGILRRPSTAVPVGGAPTLPPVPSRIRT